MSSNPPVVCDNGTGFVKAGYAGKNFPEAIFPSMVGRPVLRSEEKVSNIQIKDIMCGDECAQLRHMLECNYPISEGIVQSWDDMEHLWNYTFFERLEIDPSHHKVCMQVTGFQSLSFMY